MTAPVDDHGPSITPEGAESLEVLIINLCLCAVEIKANYEGTATEPLSPQCRDITLALGDLTDGVGTATFVVATR